MTTTTAMVPAAPVETVEFCGLVFPVARRDADGTIWVKALDAARVLGQDARDGRDASEGVPEEMKGRVSNPPPPGEPGGVQTFWAVTMEGLLHMAVNRRGETGARVRKALVGFTQAASSTSGVLAATSPSLDPDSPDFDQRGFDAMIARNDPSEIRAWNAHQAHLSRIRSRPPDAAQIAAAVARAVTEAVAPAIMRGLAQSRRDAAWERKRRAAGQTELPGMLAPEPLPLNARREQVRAALSVEPRGLSALAARAGVTEKTARRYLGELRLAGTAQHDPRNGWSLTQVRQ